MSLLEVRNLHAGVQGNAILEGINLSVGKGEIHAIMGPNGSGKSTLAGVLAGREAYVVTEGEVLYQGKDLLGLSPEERAREGLFLAFQYPVEIPGVTNMYFLKAALNAIRKHRGIEELDAMEFIALVKEKMKVIDVDQSLLNRPVNEGRRSGIRFSRWRSSTRRSRYLMKRIPGSTSTRSGSSRKGSTGSVPPKTRSSSSRITSAC